MDKVSSIDEYFARLGERFVASEAKGVNCVIQYDFSGDGSGQFHFAVNDGVLGPVTAGEHASPSVTITMTGANFLLMGNGDLDGAKAYMTRKMKVKGKIPLAQKMKKFLPPAS
ncbi:MAG: SCP2 sterol-binding domain-containing protein [Polyangiales bacterium]|nr:SCP2 sterol-binding domain-containing protein [Myxococcales bacterium]MCB9662267.1 SCP2 sterol-binding domain-containing protein [Sandaracinaceae bacterium]